MQTAVGLSKDTYAFLMMPLKKAFRPGYAGIEFSVHWTADRILRLIIAVSCVLMQHMRRMSYQATLQTARSGAVKVPYGIFMCEYPV